MLIINDTLGTYGGSITLIERLCTWAVNNNESIKVYCNDVSNKEITTKLDNLGVRVACFDTYNEKELFKHITEDLSVEDIQIVSFILNNYLSVETVKKKYKLTFVNVIYSIHPATFFKGTGAKAGFYKDLILKRYKKTIQKINDNNAIIFMDQDNVDSTEKYYGFRFEASTKICALPMICTPKEEIELEKKIDDSYQNRIIFTSSRADFPFKGYIFGLIDDFSQLSSKYPDIRLCIVCSGDSDDVQKVKDKIASFGEDVRSRIEFHDWIKYENLLQLISQSYLYVGMGTGVLDAAISYVPAIAVKYNTYDDLADCFLYERPNYVVAEESCESRAILLMEKLLSCDRDSYGKISRKCFEEVAQIYDVKSFFENIKTIKKRESYLTNLDVWIHSINTFINSLKKQKHYDVNNIQYEEGD